MYYERLIHRERYILYTGGYSDYGKRLVSSDNGRDIHERLVKTNTECTKKSDNL